MNFAAFDLNLLRVFDALMRERSATRAGDMIGLSQPAVSNALNRLRHALKDELFVRRGNDMVPTPRAEAMAERVRDALAALEQTVASDASFDPATAERIFTLFGSDFFSLHLMPSFASRLAKTAPGVVLRYIDSASGDVERLLRDNTIDVALEAPMPMPDWVSRDVLFTSPFAVIAARDNATIRKAGIKPGAKLPLKLFCDLPFALRSIDGSLSGMVDDALRKVGASRRVVLTLPQFQSVARAVAESGLIATVPVQFARLVAKDLGLAVYRLPIDVPVPEVLMYWHRRNTDNSAQKWLRAGLLAAAKPFQIKGI